nr:MAG TPA: minor structural protein [Caudoviricetes sp.]
MNREFLKSIEGLTDADIEKIIIENGKDIQREKEGLETVKNELKTAKDTVTNLTGELQQLKNAGASAEEWKQKFEALQTEIAEKEAAAKAEREKAEREADIKSRYNAVCVDKDGKPLEFTHDAIRTEYLRKFGEILSDIDNTEYRGKSDADIFHALTKDDGAAFKGVQAQVTLPGAQPLGSAGEPTTLLGALQRQYNKQ